MTDSNLDIKLKRVINKYNPKEKRKLNEKFLFEVITKPFTIIHSIKKKRKKLTISTYTRNEANQTQQINSIIKSKKYKYNSRNKYELKRYKSLSNNISNKESIERDKNSDNENKNIVSSDILGEKTLFSSLKKQFSINLLINNKLKENKVKKITFLKKNINEYNFKSNYNPIKKEEEKKGVKNITKFILRNNLYFKHSSTLSETTKREKNTDIENKYYYKMKKIKENKKENHTFSEPNNKYNFNDIYKRNLNFHNIKINKRIINTDDKIYINCLISKLNSKINANKLFQKNCFKTMYNIQNDYLYKRIHSLDRVFTKLMKNK